MKFASQQLDVDKLRLGHEGLPVGEVCNNFYGFLRHPNDREVMQNHTQQSEDADFSSKRTSSDPPPSETNIVRLKQNACNWRRPLKGTSVSKQAKTAFSSYMGRRCEKSLIVEDSACDLHCVRHVCRATHHRQGRRHHQQWIRPLDLTVPRPWWEMADTHSMHVCI